MRISADAIVSPMEVTQDLDCFFVIFPGEDRNVTLKLDLVKEGVSVNIYGLYVTDGHQKVGIDIDVNHSVGGCRSTQLLKGIASGESRVKFSGRIKVAPDAQLTDASQGNHSLLLSDRAIVETSPQLEIYADDVKCSHGATVGRLDEQEQFYMRSRGISEEMARKLQMVSFLSEVVSGICPEEGEDRDILSSEVLQALGRIAI